MSKAPQSTGMPPARTVAGRSQQLIVALVIAGLAASILIVSLTVEDPEPYLFPQMISGFMLALAVVAVFRALTGRNRTGVGVNRRQLGNIVPGLAIMLLYVFALAEFLGFYSAAFICMLGLYTLYDPNPHKTPKTWAVRLAVCAGFIALIYLVFAVGLKVQTPQGILI